MHFSRMKMLAGMEFLKLPARINIVFSLVVIVVVDEELTAKEEMI